MIGIEAAFGAMDSSEVNRCASVSLLTRQRLASIGECLLAACDVPGDTAEVGVAAGGTSRLIAKANGGRRHWACDTFDGLADCSAIDVGLTNKMFQNVRPPVEKFLAGCENVQLVPGYFPASAPAEMAAARFSFVHIDVDTYQSILGAFAFFSERMSPGGFIALDDVLPAGSGCPGAQLAWTEIVARGGLWRVYSETPPQVVVIFHG